MRGREREPDVPDGADPAEPFANVPHGDRNAALPGEGNLKIVDLDLVVILVMTKWCGPAAACFSFGHAADDAVSWETVVEVLD